MFCFISSALVRLKLLSFGLLVTVDKMHIYILKLHIVSVVFAILLPHLNRWLWHPGTAYQCCDTVTTCLLDPR